jgi:MFS family permease
MVEISDIHLIRFASFGMDLAVNIYLLAAPLLLIEIGANPVELGLIASIPLTVHVLLARFMGTLSDRWGRRPFVVCGPLFIIGSCAVITTSRQIEIILASSALNGLAYSFFWPAFEAWIADSNRETGLVRDIAAFNMAWTLAFLIGPILSGLLYSYSPRYAFFGAAAIALALTSFTATFLKERRSIEGQAEEAQQAGRLSWHMSFLYAVWVALFVSYFVLGNARIQFPKLARELNLSSETIGLLLGSIGFAEFAGFFLLGRTRFRDFHKYPLLAAQFLMVGAVMLLLTSDQVMHFIAAFLLIGVSISVTYFSSIYLVLTKLERRGWGMGMHESILAAGALIGPFLGGIAAQYAGSRAPYFLCLLICLIGILVEVALFWLARKPLGNDAFRDEG